MLLDPAKSFIRKREKVVSELVRKTEEECQQLAKRSFLGPAVPRASAESMRQFATPALQAVEAKAAKTVERKRKRIEEDVADVVARVPKRAADPWQPRWNHQLPGSRSDKSTVQAGCALLAADCSSRAEGIMTTAGFRVRRASTNSMAKEFVAECWKMFPG